MTQLANFMTLTRKFYDINSQIKGPGFLPRTLYRLTISLRRSFFRRSFLRRIFLRKTTSDGILD
jgi:hypothetical protein